MNKAIDRKKLNKKIFYISCASVFALGLLVSVLTLAYFSSKDDVTNKISANDVKIELLEPEWYDHGKADAQKLEPGMIIDKDPQVLNKSESAVYVRMRFVIKIGNTEITPDDERYSRLMSAINFTDSDGSYKPFVEFDNEKISENTNPEFAMADDGWYYYYKDGKLTALDPGKTTSELFSFLKIPTLKSEYNGYFDSSFSISVEAQAISAEIKAENENDIKAAFESRYK